MKHCFTKVITKYVNEGDKKMRKKTGKLALFLLAAIFVLFAVFSSCSAGKTADVGGQKKQFTVRYICKKLSDSWFSTEDKGAISKAEELGIDYGGIDVDYNNERCMQAVDSVISAGVDAVAICVPDAGLGPAVIRAFREANIPVLAIDDILEDGTGYAAPYLGVPTYDFGYEGGEALAARAKERNFFAPGNVIKVMVLGMYTVPTVKVTCDGFRDALLKNCPELKPADIIETDCKTGTFDDSIAAALATINANPNVTHWIVPCGEDTPAYATVRAFIEKGFDFKKILVSGTGCYQPSLDVFNMGGDIANSYISMYMDPFLEGQTMIQFFYDLLVNGKELPQETLVGAGVVSIDNWREKFPDGKMPY
ncbi:MAG: substrate-binding domain-containing protein [Treponema sp.]|jgi:L-arabinose transport system substrate-binding protein|nr:substrate-binding domain-containing protein [Treponema sp.]